jgi:hypothetical protein
MRSGIASVIHDSGFPTPSDSELQISSTRSRNRTRNAFEILINA